MTIYISGRISGENPVSCKKKFSMYEKELKSLGYMTVNPINIGINLKKQLGREPSYKEYMKADLAELKKCDAICLIPDWKKSFGAVLEREFATDFNLNVVEMHLSKSSKW